MFTGWYDSIGVFLHQYSNGGCVCINAPPLRPHFSISGVHKNTFSIAADFFWSPLLCFGALEIGGLCLHQTRCNRGCLQRVVAFVLLSFSWCFILLQIQNHPRRLHRLHSWGPLKDVRFQRFANTKLSDLVFLAACHGGSDIGRIIRCITFSFSVCTDNLVLTVVPRFIIKLSSAIKCLGRFMTRALVKSGTPGDLVVKLSLIEVSDTLPGLCL